VQRHSLTITNSLEVNDFASVFGPGDPSETPLEIIAFNPFKEMSKQLNYRDWPDSHYARIIVNDIWWLSARYPLILSG
jgi:hypothetical protein